MGAFLLRCKTKLHPVNQNVQTKPDHVHEVPVPSRTLKTEVTLFGEVTLLQAQSDEQQHEHANEHVEAMEAREHVESRAINTRAQLQIQIAPCVSIFITLHEQKHQAQNNRHPHELDGFAAVAVL